MRNKQVFFIITTIFALFAFRPSAYGQESPEFKDRIWWGGGFALGFSTINNITTVQLGLSPMVGYKFTERFSAGPRVSALMSYFSARTFTGPRDNKFAPTWAGGIFSRYKLPGQLFAHLEYEFENRAFVVQDIGGLVVNRNNFNNYYIGAGYNSNGGELLILYNLNTVSGFQRTSPFVFRFGFTRNF
ncbi:MAG: hypothetical protein ACOYOO_04955 [Saprospiraceae bacterium]|jgi:hypothetical protein